MQNKADILISIEARHVTNMLKGLKTVELRRRPIYLAPESKVWIYSKLPRGHVDAVATVERIHVGSPSYIWRKYGKRCCISKKEFDKYYNGLERAYAIELKSVKKLQSSVALAQFRQLLSNFQPPQFFKKLGPSSPELGLLQSCEA